MGATLALLSTTALGVNAGVHLLKHMPLELIHKLSGVLFWCSRWRLSIGYLTEPRCLLSKLQETNDILRGLNTPDILATPPVVSDLPGRF